MVVILVIIRLWVRLPGFDCGFRCWRILGRLREELARVRGPAEPTVCIATLMAMGIL